MIDGLDAFDNGASSPAVAAASLSAGWSKKRGIVRGEDEEEVARQVVQLGAVEEMAAPVASVTGPSAPAEAALPVEAIARAAHEAYLEEFAYLMAQEVIRKAQKRKRDAELLLLW